MFGDQPTKSGPLGPHLDGVVTLELQAPSWKAVTATVLGLEVATDHLILDVPGLHGPHFLEPGPHGWLLVRDGSQAVSGYRVADEVVEEARTRFLGQLAPAR